MPDFDIDTFRDRLLLSGIAPRYIDRAMSELRDHFEDIESKAAESGLSRADARRLAAERIGALESISRQYSNKPDLKRWGHRHPQLARVVFPAAYVIMLPVAPIHAGIENAPLIIRWCASLLLGAIVTVAMLLAMYLPIVPI